jgi:PAS domain S-box-containing protein
LGALSLLVLIPMGLGGLYRADAERQESVARATEALHATLDHIVVANGGIVEDVAASLDVLARLPEIRDLDPVRCEASLVAIREGTRRFSGLVLADATGRVVCNSWHYATANYRGDRLDFRRVLETGRFSVGEYVLARVSGVPVIHFGQPVLGATGELAGVLTASIPAALLNERLARIPLPAGHVLSLTDHAGVIAARHPAPERHVGRTMPSATKLGSPPASRGTIEADSVDGIPRLFVFSPFGEERQSGLTLWLGVDKTQITASADAAFSRMLWALMALAAAMAGTVWLGGMWLLRRPAQRLAGVAQRIAAGDLTPRVGPPYAGGEIGGVEAAFDRLMDKLCQRETELRASEERLRLALAGASAGAWEWDIATGRTTWSPENYDIYGIDPTADPPDYEGRIARFHPDDRARVDRDIRGAINAGHSEYRGEYRLLHPTRGWRWILGLGRVVRTPDGTPARMYGINLDITERKQVELRLQESEARLRLSQDAGRVGVCDWNVLTGELYFSDSLHRILGSDPDIERPTLEGFMARVHSGDRAAVEQAVDDALHGARPLDVEFRIVRPDGNVRWLESRAEVLRAPDGAPVRVIGVDVDVTARKLAERKLETSERQLRLALDAGGMGTWGWDLATDSLVWDARQFELFGIDPGHVTGAEALSRIHRDDIQRVKGDIARTLKAGGEFESEFRIIHPNGEIRWLAGRGRGVADPANGPVRMIGLNFDITEQKRAADRLALLAREVDHRSRNILSLVRAMIRMTRADTAQDFAKAALGRIDALARANNLLSRTRWQGIGLKHLIEEELAPYRRDDAVRVRVEGPDVLLDATAAQTMSMALHELATNAAKYGAFSVAEGRVSVRWSREGDQFVLAWKEEDGPPVSAPDRRGTGTHVIEGAIAHQFEGTVRFDWPREGLVCTITVAADKLAKAEPAAS